MTAATAASALTADEQYRAHIKAIVAKAPPLSPERQATLRALLLPFAGGTGQPRDT